MRTRRAHRADQGLRPARPRRRRLPHRDEVGLHPAGRRQAALPGGQRRRGRAGHLQGHAADDGRPARADRGLHHRLLRDPRAPARSSTSAARWCTWSAGCTHAVARPTPSRLPRQEHPRLRLRPRHRRARRRRRLHLRRGDRAARLAGGLPRPAAAAPPFPAIAGPVRLPDGGQQRRVHRQRARRSCSAAADWWPHDGHREVARAEDLLAVRPRHQPRPVRGAAGHHAARAARAGRRHAGRAPAEVLDAGRLVDAAAHRRAPRRAAGLRGRRPRPARCSAPRRCRSSTRPPAWCRGVLRWLEFYQHESCGKCTPCREGTYWMVQILRAARVRRGHARDLDTLLDTCDNILGRSFCALGDGATSPVTSSISTSATSTSSTCVSGGCPFDPAAPTLFGERTDDDVAPASSRRPTADPAAPTGYVRSPSTASRSPRPRATLVIRAAERLGIAIPRFCDHPLLDPVGACRQCLVEVEGQRKPAAPPAPRRSPTAWWSRPSSPRRSPRRRSAASWSCC